MTPRWNVIIIRLEIYEILDWDKMEADKQLLTIPAQALQAVSQQLAVSVDPPGFVHQLVQLLVLVLSCKHGNVRRPNKSVFWWTSHQQFWNSVEGVWVNGPACGNIHWAMTSRSFSSAMLESSPVSGSWMKKPSLGFELQRHNKERFLKY